MKQLTLQQAGELIKSILSTPKKYEELTMFEKGVLLYQAINRSVLSCNFKKLQIKLTKIGYKEEDIIKLYQWRNIGENGLITWGHGNYINIFLHPEKYSKEQVERQLESLNKWMLVKEYNFRGGILA